MKRISDRFRPPYWQLIEPFWHKISIYEGPDRFLADLNAAPNYIRPLFATHWLQSEVRNGGFGQFFDNPTGVLAPEAADGFVEITMPEAAAFVRSRMSLFGETYPRDREARQALMFAKGEGADGDVMDTLSGPMEDRFYELLKSENGGFLACANSFAARVLR